MATSRVPKAGRPFPQVVSDGNLRASLEALRGVLAAALVEAPPVAKAPLANQLRGVLRDLAALPESKKVSKADELAARRQARRPTAEPTTSPKRQGRQ